MGMKGYKTILGEAVPLRICLEYLTKTGSLLIGRSAS